jgi:uncharacterized repeat protein (TIGR01451 family)
MNGLVRAMRTAEGRRRRTGMVAAAAAVAASALTLSAAPAFGEGSREFNSGPPTGQRHALDGRTVMSVYARAGERIQLGHTLMGSGAANIRVWAPGVDSATGTPVLNCAASQPGRGTIASRAQELAGPLPAAGGYTPCEMVATTDGVYSVVMIGSSNFNDPGGTVANPYLGANANLSMWDVTVRDAGNVVRPGRLFSNEWLFRTGGAGDTNSYVYTRTGYEYQVNFFDHSGINWIMTADDTGLLDRRTGERLYSSFIFQDVTAPGMPTYPTDTAQDVTRRFPQFVNRVDPDVISGPGGLAATRGYSTTPISPSSQPLSNTAFAGAKGQPGGTDHGAGGTISFSSPSALEGLPYSIAIDTDRDGTFGNGSDFVDSANRLSASGSNSLAWGGRDGAGAVLQCGAYQYQVKSTLSEVHFVQADVEASGGMRVERLTLPGDPDLGNPLALSYNDRDPFKNNRPVTDANPIAVTDGTSGPGFHAYGDPASADPTRWAGDGDNVDSWTRLPEVTATGTFRVLCADLAIEKTATQNPAFPDQNLTYDLTVRNNGPDAAQNVVVSDSLPANVSYVSSTEGCTVNGATVECRLASLAIGASHTFKVTVRVAASAEGTLVNTAEVRSDTHDPEPRNNRDDESVPVEPLADLEIVKRALSDRLVPGRPLEYELIVTNHGPSTARDVRMSDPLPRGLSFVSASRGCTFASGTVTCNEASLAVGRSVTYRVLTRVAASVTANSIANTATVEGSTRDPDPGNNRDTERVPSGPEADLSITKIPSVDTVKVGGQLFYTLLIRNDGPSDAQRVVVNDTAGAGLTLLSAQSSQGGSCTVTATRVTCSLGTLAVGGTAQVLVSARADQVGTLTNTATVESPTEDPNRRNNRDERRVPSEPGPLPQPADLEIVKTANRRSILGSGKITYALRVRNLGPGTATDVQVVDTPSQPIRVRSVRPSVGRCTTSVPVRCALGTLASGASATIRIVAQPLAPGTLRNSASVTGNEPDPNPRNNIDGATVRVQGLLKLTKVVSAKTVRAGGTVTYKIKVTNASAFALRSVRVCDDLPSGLVFVSSTPKAKLVKGRHCWTVRALGAKKSKTFTMKVRVLRGAGGRKVNVATATAPNARGARSRAATGTAAIRVLPVAARGGGVTG